MGTDVSGEQTANTHSLKYVCMQTHVTNRRIFGVLSTHTHIYIQTHVSKYVAVCINFNDSGNAFNQHNFPAPKCRLLLSLLLPFAKNAHLVLTFVSAQIHAHICMYVCMCVCGMLLLPPTS